MLLLREPAILRFEGGNLTVDLDEEDYRKGVEELKFSIVGRLFLLKRSIMPTIMELKNKMMEIWGIQSCRWFIWMVVTFM